MTTNPVTAASVMILGICFFMVFFGYFAVVLPAPDNTPRICTAVLLFSGGYRALRNYRANLSDILAELS
jgi:hypothetical protein